jgi:hypothetical protein
MTSSAQEDDFRRQARALRFAPELARQQQEQQAAAQAKARYLADFDQVAGTVWVEGAWDRHYNNDTPENTKFCRLVDQAGTGLTPELWTRGVFD